MNVYTPATGVVFFPSLASLMLYLRFRVAKITRCDEPFVRRFVFLGCCTQIHPPYTPLRTLLIARPLVRYVGSIFPTVRCFRKSIPSVANQEPLRINTFPRALIISVIGEGVPAFAIYLIVIMPTTVQIYIRNLGPFDTKSGDHEVVPP